MKNQNQLKEFLPKKKKKKKMRRNEIKNEVDDIKKWKEKIKRKNIQSK